MTKVIYLYQWIDNYLFKQENYKVYSYIPPKKTWELETDEDILDDVFHKNHVDILTEEEANEKIKELDEKYKN